MKNLGWIALDIDGTLTADPFSVPRAVSDELRALQQRGWRIAVATGRPFAFAFMAIQEFAFPFFFIAQNGSATLALPEKKLLARRYLQRPQIAAIECAYEGLQGDFLLYAGFEKGDFCYWRPERYSEEELAYLSIVQKRQSEPWRAVAHFREVETVPLVKCFGPPERMRQIAERLRSLGGFELTHIRDPFDAKVDLLLVTAEGVSKGHALAELIDQQGRGEKVIAAGDDRNDLSLFAVADVKIAMPHAPSELKERADIIAPPVDQMGILSALKQAAIYTIYEK